VIFVHDNSIIMGKRSRESGEGVSKTSKSQEKGVKSSLIKEQTVDPTLALLFASSVSFHEYCILSAERSILETIYIIGFVCTMGTDKLYRQAQ
jgi:hypothetical protein